MPSDRPMPIAPVPFEDLSPTVRALVDNDEAKAFFAGLISKAGPLADLFLPYYLALRDPVDGKSLNVLGPKLTELVRLAVATTTGCEACLQYRDPRAGLESNVISLFDELDEADFTPRERAALRYTLTFCTNHHKIDDAMWDELKSLFDDQELMTLCLFVATFLGTARLGHAWRLIDAHCTMPGYRLSPIVEAKARQEVAEEV